MCHMFELFCSLYYVSSLYPPDVVEVAYWAENLIATAGVKELRSLLQPRATNNKRCCGGRAGYKQVHVHHVPAGINLSRSSRKDVQTHNHNVAPVLQDMNIVRFCWTYPKRDALVKRAAGRRCVCSVKYPP